MLGVVQAVKQLSRMIGICHLPGKKLIALYAITVTVWGHMWRKVAVTTTCFVITA